MGRMRTTSLRFLLAKLPCRTATSSTLPWSPPRYQMQNLAMRSAMSTNALQSGVGRGGRQQRRQQRHAVRRRVCAIAVRGDSPQPPMSPTPSNDAPERAVSARRPSVRASAGRRAGVVVPQSVALPTPPTDEHSTERQKNSSGPNDEPPDDSLRNYDST